MTAPATAKLLVSINSGAYTSGGLTATAGQSVALQAQSTSGYYAIKYEIYDYPPGFTAPSGWSTDAAGVIYYAPSNPTTPPPTFNLASTSTQWGKYALRLSANNNPLRLNSDGSPNAAFTSTLTDETTMIEVASPNLAMPGIAFNETTQYDTLRAWAGQIMACLRLVDTNMASVVRTFASVTHASSPYTALSTDALIDVDVSAGVVTINLEASPASLTSHTVKNSAGDASVSNITVSGNGHNIEDPNSPGTYSASVLIKNKGQSQTWQYDGTKWQAI